MKLSISIIALVLSFCFSLNCSGQTTKTYYMRNGAVFHEIESENNDILTNEYGDTIVNGNNRYTMFSIKDDRNVIEVAYLYGEAYSIVDYEGNLIARFPTGKEPLVWIDGIYTQSNVHGGGYAILDSKGNTLFYKKKKYPHFTRQGLKSNSDYLTADFLKDYCSVCETLSKGKWEKALNQLQPFVNDSVLWAIYLKGHLLRFGNKKIISDNKYLYNDLTDSDKEEGLNLLIYAANKNSIPAIYEVFLEFTKHYPKQITPERFNMVKNLYNFYGDVLDIKIKQGLSKCYLEGYGTDKNIIKAFEFSSSYSKTAIEEIESCYYDETKIVDYFLSLPNNKRKEYFPEFDIEDEDDMCARGLLEYCRNPKSAEAVFWLTCAARFAKQPDALYLISEMVKGEEVYTGMLGNKYKYWLNLAAEQGSPEALKIMQELEIAEENARIEQAKIEEERSARRAAIAEALVLGIVNTSANLATNIANYQNLKRNNKYTLNTLPTKNVSQKNTYSASSSKDDDDETDDGYEKECPKCGGVGSILIERPHSKMGGALKVKTVHCDICDDDYDANEFDHKHETCPKCKGRKIVTY